MAAPRRTLCAFALVAGLTAAAAVAAPARADIASDIRADLVASGAPVTTVVLETPPAAAKPLDTLVSGALPFDGFKPYFSPSYASPRPVAHIVLSVGNGQPLKGVLTTPGLPPTSVTDVTSKVIVWRLAAVEAVKHAVAAGSTLVAMQLDAQTPRGTWRALQAIPNTSIWTPREPGPTGMTVDEVRAAAAGALPGWAQPVARVSVTEDAVRERVVSADLALPSSAFASVNVRDVSDALADVQRELGARGGKVGRTIVRVTDTVTGDPLFTSGDDRRWGYGSEWISPRVVGLPGFQKLAVTKTVPEPGSALANPTTPSTTWSPPSISRPPIR